MPSALDRMVTKKEEKTVEISLGFIPGVTVAGRYMFMADDPVGTPLESHYPPVHIRELGNPMLTGYLKAISGHTDELNRRTVCQLILDISEDEMKRDATYRRVKVHVVLYSKSNMEAFVDFEGKEKDNLSRAISSSS